MKFKYDGELIIPAKDLIDLPRAGWLLKKITAYASIDVIDSEHFDRVYPELLNGCNLYNAFRFGEIKREDTVHVYSGCYITATKEETIMKVILRYASNNIDCSKFYNFGKVKKFQENIQCLL